MMTDRTLEPRSYIAGTSAKIYGVGLHWHVHIQGALEIAKMCKTLHPDALVVLGGLTATRFHSEIIQQFDFVDAVIRGEAEKPLLEFIRAYENQKRIVATSNVTCRDGRSVTVAPLMKPSTNLDEFEFTRLSLLEPKRSIFGMGTPPHLSMFICRGCVYNCVSCGGSAYSYRTYFGMERPSFRSPKKLAEDVQKLVEQKVRLVGLLQDARMGGKKYWTELLSTLRKENPDVERLTMELFRPADEEFITELANVGKVVALNMSPESGSYEVRKVHGRNYTNNELLTTVKLCQKHGIPLTLFFMLGLARENFETIEETRKLCDKLCAMEREATSKNFSDSTKRFVPLSAPIMGHMIFVDPGSRGFDYPDEYGYSLLYRELKDDIRNMNEPHWSQRLNFETKELTKDKYVDLVYKTSEFIIDQREKYGLLNPDEIAVERFSLKLDKALNEEVERIEKEQDETSRRTRLRCLKFAFDSFFSNPRPVADPYGYSKMIHEISQETHAPFFRGNAG
jgi:B12-binding domain/radical SAM domain protein